MNNPPEVKRFPLGKFGLKMNPVGEFVAMSYQGRTLLGEVTEVYYDEFRSGTFAKVKHFNGEMWPLEPGISFLEWIQQNSV